MEKERDDRQIELVNILYEKLSDLYYMEEKGWNVEPAIKEVQKQISSLLSKSEQERIAQLREELKNERERMSGTSA
ncbi:MAG: hypothetical protein KatS3mg101_0990 [Patescibacteria group bacterium]|nr:MAG: hypothetical protein KatS3mg101_0990 [Patescibacteria group bacterium]